ncbi:hypothetical protein Tco_1300668 [Tanacetum coccineum]
MQSTTTLAYIRSYPNTLNGQGSTHGSTSVNEDEEDDSPVEEVSPVKHKKPSRRAIRAKKNDPKEPPKEWTVEEEIALCQSWCDVSENNIVGNSMKTKGFWDAAERREAAELKREKIEIQRRTLELAEREKRDRDILFYNTEINSSLPAIQQQKLQVMKDEIRERNSYALSSIFSPTKRIALVASNCRKLYEIIFEILRRRERRCTDSPQSRCFSLVVRKLFSLELELEEGCPKYTFPTACSRFL